MLDFAKFLDDDRFLDWVLLSDAPYDFYWREYMRHHPDQVETIEFLRKAVRALSVREGGLSDSDKEAHFQMIKAGVAQRRQQVSWRARLQRGVRYAAVFVLLLSMMGGGYLFFRSQGDVRPDREALYAIPMESVSDTRLILAGGDSTTIRSDRSTIDYSQAGQVVVDQRDTLGKRPPSEAKAVGLNRVLVPFGKRSKVLLPDGTQVHLNSGSRFPFPPSLLVGSGPCIWMGRPFLRWPTIPSYLLWSRRPKRTIR